MGWLLLLLLLLLVVVCAPEPRLLPRRRQLNLDLRLGRCRSLDHGPTAAAAAGSCT
jgi:hypothetical protein